MTALRMVAAIVSSLLATLAGAQERVSFPSFDGAGNAPVVLSGYFFAAATSPAPAIAMFHGCGGAYDKSGALSRRERREQQQRDGDDGAQCRHPGSPPVANAAAGGSGCRRAIANAST